MHPSRRLFIKQTLAATAALSLPAKIYSQAAGSNDAIRLGAIGFKGRGMANLDGLLKAKGVRLTALCDCDESVLTKGKATFEGKGQTDVQTYKDMRKLMDDKNVDVIMVATPNHWHSLAGIWGIQAGKDVYVEKPVSHNVWEGRKLVEASRKYKKIVQTGTQSRSSGGLHQAVKWAGEGNLGKIQWARGTCYKRRASIGDVTEPQPIPAGIDYDLWCGPAPMDPLMRKNLHYDWHWVWSTGNGDLGNQGIHQMDIARWFLGESALSPAVYSIGGRLGYKDDGETPNTQLVVHDYAKAPLYFEVRGLPVNSKENKMDSYRGSSVGVVVQYENGYIVIPSYTGAAAFDNSGKMIQRWGSFAAPKDQPDPGKAEGAPDLEDHYKNFISAVRSRKSSDLTADIEEGHISSALCHTGNISYLMGKMMAPEAIQEKVKGDKEALDSINRMIEHLRKNDVDVSSDLLTLGEFLKMDPKTEKFIGNAEADKLLTRKYRAPYVVPEKV